MGQAGFTEPTIEDRELLQVACIRREVGMEEIPEFYDSAFPTIFSALGELGVDPSAPPMGIVYGQAGDTLDLAVAVPVAERFAGMGDVRGETLPAARTAILTVAGDYAQLPAAHDYLQSWVSERGLVPAGWVWEQYLTEPVPGGDPAENITRLGLGLQG